MTRHEWEQFVSWCINWERDNYIDYKYFFHFSYYHYNVKNDDYEDVDVRKNDTAYKKVDAIMCRGIVVTATGGAMDVYSYNHSTIAESGLSIEELKRLIIQAAHRKLVW